MLEFNLGGESNHSGFLQIYIISSLWLYIIFLGRMPHENLASCNYLIPLIAKKKTQKTCENVQWRILPLLLLSLDMA